MNNWIIKLFLIAVFIQISNTIAVAGNQIVDFDIRKQDSQLAVWIDISSLIGASERDYLSNGQGVVIDCKIELRSPRKLFGSRTISTVHKTLNITQRLITDNYLLTTYPSDSGDISFLQIEHLLEYLSSEVTISVYQLDSLQKNKNYDLELTFLTISMSNSKLLGITPDSSNSESSFSYLFRQFLKLTNHGKNEFSINSRLFSIDELSE